MGVSRGEEYEKEDEINIWKNNYSSFPNLMKYMNLHIQEVYQILIRVKSVKSILRNIIIKVSKAKDDKSILKSAREKWFIIYKGPSVGSTANFMS